MKFMTTSQAGELLNRTSKRVRELCEDGAFPNAFRSCPGGHWSIPEDDVRARIEAGKARVIRRAKAA